MKLKTKILLGIGLIVSSSMLVLATIVSTQASTKAAESLTKASEQQLTAVRDTKKSQIEEYFDLINKQAVTLAADETVGMAMKAFAENFESMQGDIPDSTIENALNN
jgi:methyl-accepting chemotaxis protein